MALTCGDVGAGAHHESHLFQLLARAVASRPEAVAERSSDRRNAGNRQVSGPR